MTLSRDEDSTNVLRELTTEAMLFKLQKHGVIRDLESRGGGGSGVLPGWKFYNTATGEKIDGATEAARRYALGLQHNLNIVLERNAPIRTEAGLRVFFPGDELPKGIYVMGPDERVALVEYSGMKVKATQVQPIVEVVLPNYRQAVAEAGVRRASRRERDA